MTSTQIRLFSTLAAESRLASYPVTATFNGGTITLAAFPLSDMELAAGGWERGGVMRALTSGDIIPDEQDRLGIDGKTWVVRKKRTSAACVETSLTLEAVPGIRDQ